MGALARPGTFSASNPWQLFPPAPAEAFKRALPGNGRFCGRFITTPPGNIIFSRAESRTYMGISRPIATLEHSGDGAAKAHQSKFGYIPPRPWMTRLAPGGEAHVASLFLPARWRRQFAGWSSPLGARIRERVTDLDDRKRFEFAMHRDSRPRRSWGPAKAFQPPFDLEGRCSGLRGRRYFFSRRQWTLRISLFPGGRRPALPAIADYRGPLEGNCTICGFGGGSPRRGGREPERPGPQRRFAPPIIADRRPAFFWWAVEISCCPESSLPQADRPEADSCASRGPARERSFEKRPEISPRKDARRAPEIFPGGDPRNRKPATRPPREPCGFAPRLPPRDTQ